MPNKTYISLCTVRRGTKDQATEAFRRIKDHFGDTVETNDWIRQMKESEWGRDSVTTWVLVPIKDPESCDFVSSCFAIPNRCLISRPGEDGVHDSYAIIIAGVYTPPRYRGLQAARHLTAAMHYIYGGKSQFQPVSEIEPELPPRLRPEDRPSCSFLYSLVGGYYAKAGFGWKITKPYQVTWDVNGTDTFPEDVEVPSEINFLSAEEVAEAAQEDAWLTGVELLTYSKEETSGPIKIAVLPTKGNLTRHISVPCAQARPNDLRDSESIPEVWGAQFGDPSNSEWSFITWIYEGYNLTLIVTRIRAHSYDVFRALLAAAFAAARDQGLDRVVAWNVPQHLLRFDEDHMARASNDNLPAFAWYGPEDPKTVEWTPERFTWA